MLAETEIRSYVAPAGLLADRVILVTGAGGGLGGALSVACGALGARVVLSGRRVPPLERTYDAILAAGGPRPSIAPLDLELAQAAQYEALTDAVRNEFGRLDGLVHAAARPGERSPIEHHDVASWLRAMHVNVNAAFILTRSMLPLLRLSPDASVVFVSCAAALRGRAYAGVDAASRFAIEGLMQVLADETEALTSIRVNSVDPGPMRTALRRAAYPGEVPETIPEPGEALAPFLCLLGPDGRGISGRRVAAG